MEQHEEVFFRTLRSALWGETLQIPEGFSNWGKVMKLAKAGAETRLQAVKTMVGLAVQ